MNYYNENDPYAAKWLKNLIAAGLIPQGEVDDRSIRDVRASDFAGHRQCHFFAGIAGWSYALRLAGWPEDREVWTGSCPCQPFSQAGRRRGFADERHLWPIFRDLIAERRPATVFGEQVASKDGRAWLDRVRLDLEALGYAVGGADLCSAGVNAPNIRQRLYWVAHTEGVGRDERWAESGRRIAERGCGDSGVAVTENYGLSRQQGARQRRTRLTHSSGLGNSIKERRRRLPPIAAGNDLHGKAPGREESASRIERPGASARLGDAECLGQPGKPRGWAGSVTAVGRAVIGPWDGAEWITGQDGKTRRIEPGLSPLAHGLPGRVGRLRAYGNAINPWVAAEFVRAFMEISPA